MTRADRLMAYIEAELGKPVTWGRDASDCSSWPARWVERETGKRLDMPAYRDEAEARSLMAEAEGLVNLWNDVLGRAGLCSTLDPGVGDVGVLRMMHGQSGCIFGANGTAFVRGMEGPAVIGPGKKTILAAYAV
jgi:hypothetical protein